MNNFKTDYNGGLPLVLDDFRWIDEGYRKAFYGIMSAFGVTDQYTFILSGCQRSVNTAIVTIAEGYISIGGEICHVPAHSYSEPTGGDVEFWVVSTAYNAAGTKAFQNGSLNDSYETRTGQISVAAVVPPGDTLYGDTKTVHQIILESLPRDIWHNVYALTILAGEIGAGTYNVDYKLDLSGNITFRGVFPSLEDPVQGSVNILMFTLPLGLRPTVKKYMSITATSTTTSFPNRIEFDTNGEVRWRTSDTDNFSYLDFSQIVPFEVE